MQERIKRKYLRLHSLYQENGIRGVIFHAVRQLVTALYEHDVQYVFVRRLEGQKQEASSFEEKGMECILVESRDALCVVADTIPITIRFSVDSLQKKVHEGAVVVLVRWPKEKDSSQAVVGYGIYQQGVFPFLRRAGNVSPNLLFCHYVEVLPEYRGQRIHDIITKAADAYGWKKGAKRNCSTIALQNRASIVSTLRVGSTIVGKVERVSIFKGLWWWETAWEEIEAALQNNRPGTDQFSGFLPGCYEASLNALQDRNLDSREKKINSVLS